MSKRSIDTKKLNRLRKALRPTPTAFIDLTEWLRDRGYASSRSKAAEILKEGRVHVESHVVGRLEIDDPFKPGSKMWVASPLILALHRNDIRVSSS